MEVQHCPSKRIMPLPPTLQYWIIEGTEEGKIMYSDVGVTKGRRLPVRLAGKNHWLGG